MRLDNDKELEAKVWHLLAEGKGVERVAGELGLVRGALRTWLDAPERADAFIRARARAADHLAHEALEIADGAGGGDGDVSRDRLRVDTRKWLAGKWNAQQYGDSKGAQVTINLGDLHLQAVKAIKPVHGADNLVIEADAAPHTGDQAGDEGA